MKIFVGFSSSNLIGSKVIAEVEKRKYSHAYLRFFDEVTDDWMVTQASHGMVHEISFVRFSEVNKTQKEIEINLGVDQYLKLRKANNFFKGSKYSVWQLVIIFLKKFTKNASKVNGNKKFICSEWVYVLLKDSGYLFDVVENPDTLTPSELELILEQRLR